MIKVVKGIQLLLGICILVSFESKVPDRRLIVLSRRHEHRTVRIVPEVTVNSPPLKSDYSVIIKSKYQLIDYARFVLA